AHPSWGTRRLYRPRDGLRETGTPRAPLERRRRGFGPAVGPRGGAAQPRRRRVRGRGGWHGIGGPAGSTQRDDMPVPASREAQRPRRTAAQRASAAIVVAALDFAQVVLSPIALAARVTFLLSPLVTRLDRL